MRVYKDRPFLNTFWEQLDLPSSWVQDDPPCALWLDLERRLNTCCLRNHIPDSPLVRIFINKTVEFTPKWAEGCVAASDVNPSKPGWRFELTCLSHEVMPSAAWLAAIINRREGLIHKLPHLPFALLNWNDPDKLDDYLCYLSSISIWSERAFTEDIKYSCRQPFQYGQGRRLAAIPGIHGSVSA